MIAYCTQQISNSDLLKYTLSTFHRARIQQHDGAVIVEVIHCHLVYYSYDEMVEDIARCRNGVPLPEKIDFSQVKDVKWSRGLHWKEKNW